MTKRERLLFGIFAAFALGYLGYLVATLPMWRGRLAPSPPLAPQFHAARAPEDDPEPTPTSAEPQPRDFDLGFLLSEYSSNELRADQRFKRTRIRVRGKVLDVKKDILGDPYITVGTGAPHETPILQCILAKESLGSAASKSTGDPVTVVGRVRGLMINVIAEDCRL